jgi:hypothetical protein
MEKKKPLQDGEHKICLRSNIVALEGYKFVLAPNERKKRGRFAPKGFCSWQDGVLRRWGRTYLIALIDIANYVIMYS